jgi:hypothetical protein
MAYAPAYFKTYTCAGQSAKPAVHDDWGFPDLINWGKYQNWLNASFKLLEIPL